MDLSKLEETAAATFDLVVAKGSETQAPIGFRVVGPFSDQYDVVTRRQQIRNIAIQRKLTVNGQPVSDDEHVERIAELTRQHAEDVATTCTVGWFGFEIAGAEAEFTPENLARVLKARRPWVELIANAVNTEANFLKA